MARFVTGNSFSTGDQVTADTLNNAVNNAKASTDSVDNSSIAVDGSGVLSVKTSTSTSDGVTFAKFQQVPANTVLVRDANSQGSISAKAVADTQILIGDGTGFTSAALSGDVTMTNAGAVTIANDAVTGDKISDSAALPDGVTATTQAVGDNSTKVATTAFVVDMRPRFVNATGGTHNLFLQNQANGTVQTYNIADFTSADAQFATDKITGIVIESYTRSNTNSNINEATLPDGSYTPLSRAAAYGSNDEVETHTTTTIPINSDTTTISLKYTRGSNKDTHTYIRGFIIQNRL